MIRVALTAAILAIATPALADPCTARVDGYKPGQKITGLVWYAGDGDSLRGRTQSRTLQIQS